MPIYPYMMPLVVGGESPEPVLIDKTITQNGTYSAQDDDADGYSSVTVSVHAPANKFKSLVDRSITSVTAEDLDGVTRIGTSAFSNCPYLSSLTIPNTITSIGIDAFRNDNALMDIMIPDSVTTLDNACFMSDFGIIMNGNIIIGSGVSIIAGFAFYGRQPPAIIVNRNDPPVLNGTTFGDTGNCPMYVTTPDEYKVKTNWTIYASRIFPLVSTVADLANIDTTTYTKACVIGTDESYTEYTYDGSSWNAVV